MMSATLGNNIDPPRPNPFDSQSHNCAGDNAAHCRAGPCLYRHRFHVINETAVVRTKLRERVLEAIRNLGYQPSALVRGARRGLRQSHEDGMASAE
jgi:hypothetical protein